MISVTDTIANLSAEKKRALLAQMLREKAGRSRNAPLSSAQQRLWFYDKLEPQSALYNLPTVLRLRGALNPRALRRSLDSILQRHAALRTRILSTDDQPSQVIAEVTEMPWQEVDLSGGDTYERQRKANDIIHAECRRPFDLARDVMMRATLIRLSPEDHLLALVAHHIATDEWSLRVLFNELAALYGAELNNKTATLPELPIQYADYAIWQREWLKSEAAANQLAYWKEQLSGELPHLELPTDKPRRPVQTHRGGLVRHVIAKPILADLQEVSREQKSTLFMTLLAAYQALLHRYSGQADLIVGSPIAGRTRPETEPLIGFFVNTLALRARFHENITFAQLLQQTRENTLQAFANQELPFDKLVEELHPERNADGSPFVQTLFALNNDIGQAFELPGIRGEFIEVDTGTAKFDLTLVTRETPEGLEALAEFNTDLFTVSTIERMLCHFEMLLASAAANPNEAVSRLNILSARERAEIVSEWNATGTEYPREATIHQLFDAQATKTPKAIAAEFQGATITYKELQQRSNQLAHYLLAKGDCENGLIGLATERSIDMLVGMLGILKAGAAYVPLDPSYPRERLQWMIEDTGMKLLVTQSKLSSDFSSFKLARVEIDTHGKEIRREPETAPVVPRAASDLAYVIYTSGSTGKPKGACIPHRGVVRLLCNTNYIQLTSRDRVAQASNASFDAATFEIWGALLHGAKLVGIEKDTALSPDDFARSLKQQRVSALFVTTALFNQLASHVPGAFEGIGTVMFGGEACDPKWVRSVLANRPPKRLLHVYGPTESTTFTTWHEVTEVAPGAQTVPIGRPISNTEVYILDGEMNPTPVGIPGELYVGGDGLATGYLNRDDLTAQKFVQNPFGPEGSRLYRTGDLCKFRADGAVEFVGRVDHQVKIRGFRIELGEIESVLATHTNVRECAVLAREDTPGEKRLVAYIVAKQTPAPEADDLRRHIKSKLPDYMAPSAFVVLDKMPLTPNEKINRKALPAPEKTRSAVEKNFIAPRDSTEQQLAKIWEKVLGVQPIGVADNFFDLGGHSLLAVRVFALIESRFEKKLPLATLFKAPTIAELAAVLREESDEHRWNVVVDLQPKGSQPPIFWAHSLGGDGGGAFFYYRKLSELLGTDQPSYGIRSPQQPFDSIEAMAAHYIHEIRKVQPEGPYYLGGFCFGGNVAYEIARQLEEAGEEVGGLFLLESAPPPQTERKVKLTAETARYRLENVYVAFKEFATKDRSQQKLALQRRTQRLKSKLQTKLFGEHAAEPAEPKLKEVIDLANYPKEYVKYAETHWTALRHYQPKGYSGRIHLFRARKQPISSADPTLGWDTLAPGRVRVTVVPGNHETIVQEPNVQILAQHLTRCLEQARAASAPVSRAQPSLAMS
ncbi:MAG TPA: amino acid adenylation domain-containing protein [Methylomirabilota bacterium]|nr:amino acid adenylation domain-containing protein [Methylomirabilota bacterium]